MINSIQPLFSKKAFKSFFLIPSNLMYGLYKWTLKWGRTKYGTYSLFVLAFAESSFFPIPPDVLLVTVTVANRYKWWFYALIATVGSILGAIFGYYIGFALFEGIGKSIVNVYHLQKHFEEVGKLYEQNAFFSIFTAAFTPIPYKVFTIAAGVFKISLSELVIASILGRGGRFFAVALALRIFGKKVEDTIEKYFNYLSILFIALIILGFVLIRFL